MGRPLSRLPAPSSTSQHRLGEPAARARGFSEVPELVVKRTRSSDLCWFTSQLPCVRTGSVTLAKLTITLLRLSFLQGGSRLRRLVRTRTRGHLSR